jgi:hypothetical protein
MALRLFKKRKNKLKKKSLFILILICSTAVSQRDIKVITKDFDGDGSEEELIIHNYLGKIDYAVITYEEGTKKCTLDVSPNMEIPTLINTVPLCDDLLLPKYKLLSQGINKHIFRTPATKKKDPTMGWILDVYSTKKTLNNNKYFSSLAFFKPEIQKTYYQAPSPHRLLLEGELVKLINKKHKKADTTKKSWIILDANKLVEARQITEHSLEPYWPQLIDSIGDINIFKTGHSVYLETDTSHQIIFVSEGVLYNNIQKISWESIQQVGKYKDYILILTHPYPAIENKLFLIDKKKGRVMEFKKDAVLDYHNFFLFIQSFQIIEDELFLSLKETPNDKEIQEKSIPFILIKESMKAFDNEKEKKK